MSSSLIGSVFCESKKATVHLTFGTIAYQAIVLLLILTLILFDLRKRPYQPFSEIQKLRFD